MIASSEPAKARNDTLDDLVEDIRRYTRGNIPYFMIKEVLTALANSRWQLVPKEATEGMKSVAIDHILDTGERIGNWGIGDSPWSVMLAHPDADPLRTLRAKEPTDGKSDQ